MTTMRESVETLPNGVMAVSDRASQPTSDSLAHVLVQGLQTRDKQMLDTVLNNSDDKIIRNTIKKLPIDSITLLLTQLQSFLFYKSENTITYIKWMEQLLNLRLSFILTIPNIEEEFAPLIELLNARTRILDRIYKLKGRLNLMISQIRTQNNSTAISKDKPKIEYDSSSDEESDMMDDMVDDKFKDSDESSNDNEDMNSDKDDDEDQQSSDESIDGDHLMSEDDERDEDYDSSKVNDIETD